MPTEPMLTAADVAALLSVSVKTVRRQWRRWGLPGYKIGTDLRFRPREVERWIRDQRA